MANYFKVNLSYWKLVGVTPELSDVYLCNDTICVVATTDFSPPMETKR